MLLPLELINYMYSFNPPRARIASNIDIDFNKKYSYSLHIRMLPSNDTVQFELYPGANQTVPVLFYKWTVPGRLCLSLLHQWLPRREREQ